MGVLHAFLSRAWSSLPLWFTFNLFRLLLSNGLSYFIRYVPELQIECISRSAMCSPPSINRQTIAGCESSGTTAKTRPSPSDAAPLFVELFRSRTGLQNLRSAGRIASQLIALCYSVPEFGEDDVYLRDTSKWIDWECKSTEKVF